MEYEGPIRFGDNVQVRDTEETRALGLAGLTGQVWGETTPSVTNVDVIGKPCADFALNVRIQAREETYWFAADQLEFIDHASGTEIIIGKAKLVREPDGQWRDDTNMTHTEAERSDKTFPVAPRPQMSTLPSELIAKADLSQGLGLIGWRIPDFLNALQKARELGLACSGGEFEFRLNDGICELYWLNTGPVKERQSDEDWNDYVNRSASEIAENYQNLCLRANFDKEIEGWPFLREKREAGVDPIKHLWFVASFSSEDEYEDIRHRYWTENWERLHRHKTRARGGKVYEIYWKILHFFRLV